MTTELTELGLAIKRVQWRNHREVDRRLTAIGGSLAQWDALRRIDQNPGSSMHQLAELTFQSDQSFGALAARLIDRGFVERVRGPGRAQHHRLTPLGERILRDGEVVAEEVFAATFAPLEPEERETLLGLLTRLNTQAGARG